MALPSRAPRHPLVLRFAAPIGAARLRVPSQRSLRAALVLALAAAIGGALPGLTAGTAQAATAGYTANCNTNLRATAQLSGTVVDILNAGGTMTADGTVTGDSWSVTCNGDHASNSWYK